MYLSCARCMGAKTPHQNLPYHFLSRRLWHSLPKEIAWKLSDDRKKSRELSSTLGNTFGEGLARPLAEVYFKQYSQQNVFWK
jgi:hypothetical protein